MNPSTPEAVYRPSLERLAAAMGVDLPRVADWRSIPRGLVLDLADYFEVELSKGTAEEQLVELLNAAGLVATDGTALTFVPGSSSGLADQLSEMVETRNAQRARRVRRARPSALGPDGDPDAWARSKLVAVNAISALTDSGPETLGPGSKERKSVLENLHRGLGLGEPPKMPKTELATRLAKKMEILEWDRDCTSTGETITLRGLNLLLQAARKRIKSGVPGSLSAKAEADQYASIILQTFIDDHAVDPTTHQVTWDGYASVRRMVQDGYNQARGTEWPGWYFEFRCLSALISKFSGGPERVGDTVFDYRGQRLWDLKTHSHVPGSRHKQAPLNDQESIRSAIRQYGLGFIMLSGEPRYDREQDFYEWHMTEVRHRPVEERRANSRKLKTSFVPNQIEFFYFADEDEMGRAESENILIPFLQGRQQSGAARKPKFNLNVQNALEDGGIHLHSVDIRAHFSAAASSEE
ncbi:hypothetical protein N7U83_003046 [Listeria monocytogenes]|nr:hypothetical protein [Listeria monocytogenes]